MEEEVGIKVTRLRRRLSVEAEDVKSPSTQSTPTKKRGGRLAAKPQLELIDENATEVGKANRTRKSIAKEIEPDEKVLTPSRRSTRIKSNTSIVSETLPEDKETPAKRKTRIKSNTSLVAETVQFSDSPRAKRAARRTSQVGSDNETPITPARQTRRTRKDSTSSIDKQDAGKVEIKVDEVIVEESETKKQTPTKDAIRKSPRLVKQSGYNSPSLPNVDKENKSQSVKLAIDDKTTPVRDKIITPSKENNKADEVIDKNNLSVSSSKLLNNIDSEPKKANSKLNKTSEAELRQVKSKRFRTKSWTTISSSPSKEVNKFFSDSETNKRISNHNLSSGFGSGDSILNTSNKSVQENVGQDQIKEVSLNISTITEKKNNKSKILESSHTTIEQVSHVNTTTLDESRNALEKVPSANIEDLNSSKKTDPSFTEKFFGMNPSGTVQSLVYIEDSDSNTDSVKKVDVNHQLDSEDQCVPVVEHQLEDVNSKEEKINLSYEPMDIDETMPESVSLSNFGDTTQTTANKSHRKSLTANKTLDKDDNDSSLNKSNRTSIAITDNNINKSLNKSKNKSSLGSVNDNIDDNAGHSKPSIVVENINKSLNKSKSKSNMTTVSDKYAIKGNAEQTNQPSIADNIKLNKSKRKSLIPKSDTDDADHDTIMSMSKSINKSKRKSSVNNNQDNSMNILNKSNRKSFVTADNDDKTSNETVSVSIIVNDDESGKENKKTVMNKSSKSKRKSSISNFEGTDIDNQKDVEIERSNKSNSFIVEDINVADQYKRKSSVSIVIDKDEIDNSSDKHQQLHSIGNIVDDVINTSSNKSKRKSSTTAAGSDKNLDNSVNKSKKKSRFSEGSNVDQSSNKCDQDFSASNDTHENINSTSINSKRKSTSSHMESSAFNKSTNENKSTLVLSQIKDMSESNVPREIYDFNDSTEQLSKSVMMPNTNTNKESEKKNLSLTYSTSTPLQQKSLKKLGMQINTSIITPSSAKIEKKIVSNTSNKKSSVLSQNDEATEPSDDEEELSDEEDEVSDEEDEVSEEENDSMEKSKMIDDEAEEASDVYESGDSRDEDEREYEEQNEIVEKGETLDSEDSDFSDDSNYEKGSFIVDSDDEDNELLSGSGDDLSLSANELNMSAKSKMKYNERKIKEQKKASREMFEARHKLNNSDKRSEKAKSKELNIQRLETESESDEEICVQPKKNKRTRIDSSHDKSSIHSDVDISISKKKKKIKRLSESVTEDNADNEKEISIQDNKDTEIPDPLSLQNIVKQEPKTPQKDLNISTVAITNVDDLEQIDIDENVSINKSKQTSDPLQAVAGHSASEDDSDVSISENEEITQNYESMLNNLNKTANKEKSVDRSLNLNKKAKHMAEPIIDQLNLTQVKDIKKMKKIQDSTKNYDCKQIHKDKSFNNKVIEKVHKSITIQDEGSSDSIDIKLLFNEDSTDGENQAEKGNDVKELAEDFIPLKRTEAKTNILEGTDVSFFIDTTGTHTDMNTSSFTSSAKNSAKKNKKKTNISFTKVEEAGPAADDNSNDGPLEISNISLKSNKSQKDLNTSGTKISTSINESLNTNEHKKKKNKKSLDNSQVTVGKVDCTDIVTEKSINVSNLSVKGTNKKKKLSKSQTEQTTEAVLQIEPTQNVSISSGKKQKKKTVSESSVPEIVIDDGKAKTNEEAKPKKRKRTSSSNPSIEGIVVKDDTKASDTSKVLNQSLIPTNEKKKRKVVSQKEENVKPPKQETSKKNKRKERDDDEGENISKVVKQNSFDKIHVPRLPANILKQLEDKPEIQHKAKVVSTTLFKVEESRKRLNKPSNYLEQSVYLNDSTEEETKKSLLKKPKVLPFIPTASTSDNGFTTSFKVNVIPHATKFVAQSSDMTNFKKDILHKNRIKKLGTFEMYKRHRNIKISKF